MMTKQEMAAGFLKGRTLTQEEWSDAAEIQAVNELLEEKKCELLMDWTYKPGFQCEVRIVRGLGNRTLP